MSYLFNNITVQCHNQIIKYKESVRILTERVADLESFFGGPVVVVECGGVGMGDDPALYVPDLELEGEDSGEVERR